MKNNYVYVGSWLDESGKAGGGIRAYKQDPANGALDLIGTYAEDVSVGNLCVSEDKKCLYATDEIKRKPDSVAAGGSVYAFKINDDGTLEELDHIPTCGVSPNYIALSSDGEMLFAVNYGSEDIVVRSRRDEGGNYVLENQYEESSLVSVLLNPDGSLDRICDLCKMDGEASGFFAWFQSSPHAHSVGVDPSNTMVLVADRGCDEIIACNYNTGDGRLKNINKYKTEKGIGPRYCVFHESLPYVYIDGEVLPYVMCYRYDAKAASLEFVAKYLTTSEDQIYDDSKVFFDCTHPSDMLIHPDGRTLYVLNRGADTIACFRISEQDGTLSLLKEVAAEGIFPWGATIDSDGKYMYVGNKESNSIVCFEIDADGIPRYIDKSAEVERLISVKSI